METSFFYTWNNFKNILYYIHVERRKRVVVLYLLFREKVVGENF